MRGEIRSLMGLRGLAACWVVIGHYESGEWTDSAVFQVFISHFYLAVDLFMILSGFVLARTYEDRFTAPGAYRQFLLHRLARIYPLYALTSAVCLVSIWIGLPVWGDPPHTPLAIAANALMVQGWGWPNESLNSPAWSISTEWAANLLFGVLVVLLLRASGRRAMLAAAAALLCLAGFAFLLGTTPEEQMTAGQIGWYRAPYSVMRCTTEFMLGLYCWRLRARAPWAALLGGTWALLGLLAVCVISALVTTIPALDLLFVLAACGLVVGFSFERSWVADAFGGTVLRWLGTISFSLYLWHLTLLPLQLAVADALTGARFGMPKLISVAITLVAVLGVSTLSYYGFEKPCRHWLRGALRAG